MSWKKKSKKNFSNTKRKATRRPALRRGPQRGRRRRPQTVKKDESAPVDGNTLETKNESSSRPEGFSTKEITGSIKSPMPPLPRPFVREKKDLDEEQPSKEPTPPSTDGLSDKV